MSWVMIAQEAPGIIRALEAHKPTAPQTAPFSRTRRVNLRCDVPADFSASLEDIEKLKLPDVLEREYLRVTEWVKWMDEGPMQNPRQNIGPWGDGKTPFSNFDFRWITHFTFPIKFLGRIFRYSWTVEMVAELYVGLWESSRFEIVDKNLLERTLSPGLVMADLLWFEDNLSVPIVARAAKLCRTFLALHKARVARDARANFPADPKYYRRMHPMSHPAAAWALWLWGDYLLTGDKEALEGYEALTADIKKSFDYATTKDGLELVVIPHFVVDWHNKVMPDKVSYPAGAQDATYCETFMEMAISLYWAGADVFDARFLAAYANTMMLTVHSEGFGNGSEMAEAICGSVPKTAANRDNQTRLFLLTGEVVEVKKCSANRTTTRQHSISSRRAAMHAGAAWATQKYPRQAALYQGNLEAIKGIDKRLGPPAAWKLGSLAAQAGYKVTEAA